MMHTGFPRMKSVSPLKHGNHLVLIIVMVVLASFSFSEEQPSTAMEVYQGLPDDPDEVQITSLYEAAKAEAALDESLDTSGKPVYRSMIRVASMPNDFLLVVGNTRYEGTGKWPLGRTDYIFHPSLKQQLVSYIILRLLLEKAQPLVSPSLELLGALLQAESAVTALLKMSSIPGREGTQKYFGELRAQYAAYSIRDKVEKCSDELALTLRLAGDDKWAQLAEWKRAVNSFSRREAGPVAFTYWKWLRNNFTVDDVLKVKPPDREALLDTIEKLSYRELLESFVNSDFSSTSGMVEGEEFFENRGEALAMTLAGGYLCAGLGDPEGLSIRELEAFEKVALPRAADTAGINLMPYPICAIKEKCQEAREKEKSAFVQLYRELFELKLLETAITGSMSFSGSVRLDGKGTLAKFRDVIAPQLHLVMLEDFNADRDYREVSKDLYNTLYLHSATEFYEWNSWCGLLVHGVLQCKMNCPELSVPRVLDFDVTEEGVRALAASGMKRFTSGVGNKAYRLVDDMVANFDPIPVYTVDKAEYRIYSVKQLNMGNPGDLRLMKLGLVMFLPASDAKVVEASVGMLPKACNFWFKRGWFDVFHNCPYYIAEVADSREMQPVFERTRELITPLCTQSMLREMTA